MKSGDTCKLKKENNDLTKKIKELFLKNHYSVKEEGPDLVFTKP